MIAEKFDLKRHEFHPTNSNTSLLLDIRGSTGPTERWAHVCASWQVFALKWFVAFLPIEHASDISVHNMYMHLQIHNMCAVCYSIYHARMQS